MFLRIAGSALAAGGLLAWHSQTYGEDDSPKARRVIVAHPETGKALEAKRADEAGVFIVEDGKEGPHVLRHAVNLRGADTRETYLGVVTEPVPAVLAAQMPKLLGKGQGLVITKVLDDSPAAKCGIRPNDILTAVGDDKVVSSDQLKKLISGEKPGAKVELGIVRGGEAMQLAATLEDRKLSAFAVPFIMDKAGKAFDVELVNPKERIGSKGHKAAKRIATKELREELIKKAQSHAEAADALARKANEAAKRQRIVLEKIMELQHGDSKPARNVAITVAIRGDAAPKVSVEYADDKGAQIKKDFEGAFDEIRGKLGDLPAEIRDKIEAALKNISIDAKTEMKVKTGDKKAAGSDKQQRQSLMLKLISDDDVMLLEPVEGKGVFSIKLGKPDGTATLKALDFDIDLDLDNVMKSVEGIGPEVKAQILKTLDGVKLPKGNVAVEKSQ